MSFPDALLDTTWSCHFVPTDELQPSTLNPFLNIAETSTAEVAEDLCHLSHECQDYLRSQDSAVADDLSPEEEKRGSLQECVISQLQPGTIGTVSSQSPGLLIEIRFQKAVARVAFLHTTSSVALSSNVSSVCFPNLVLFKAPASYVKQVINWLIVKFGISSADPLRLPSELILKACSQYFEDLSRTWTFGVAQDGGNALELATLKQVVGNLKLTISLSLSDTARAETAGKLRTIDLEIPCESVYGLLRKTRQTSGRGDVTSAASFLDGVGETIRLRTGLTLPLSVGSVGQAGQREDEAVREPPLRVTRVSCAAFAVGTDGRLKFAKQPVENAGMIGYDEDLVRTANWNLLEMVKGEAERRAKDQAGTG